MTLVRFYTYRDMVIIPTVAQAEEGFFLDTDPVTVCDISDEKRLRQLLLEAFTGKNPVVPTPEPTDEPSSPILEKLGLRKWLKFEAEATMHTVHFVADAIEYYSTGRAVEGTWRTQAGKHIRFAKDEDIERLVDTVLTDINTDRASADQGKSSTALAFLPPPQDP